MYSHACQSWAGWLAARHYLRQFNVRPYYYVCLVCCLLLVGLVYRVWMSCLLMVAIHACTFSLQFTASSYSVYCLLLFVLAYMGALHDNGEVTRLGEVLIPLLLTLECNEYHKRVLIFIQKSS